MFEGSELVRSRLLPVLVAAVLAAGGAACGSDSDDGGSAAADGGSGAAQPAGGDAKAQVRAAYEAFVDDLYKGRFKAACDAYSAKLKKQYPKLIKVAPTCVQTLQLEFATVSVQPRPWIDKVTLKNPTTAIGVSRTQKWGDGGELRFVKEDGDWKLDGSADPRLKAGS